MFNAKLKAILASSTAQKIIAAIKNEAQISAAIDRLHRIIPLPWRWCISRKRLERFVRRRLLSKLERH